MNKKSNPNSVWRRFCEWRLERQKDREARRLALEMGEWEIKIEREFNESWIKTYNGVEVPNTQYKKRGVIYKYTHRVTGEEKLVKAFF